ncbi:hypothetical protein LTS18_014329, partial [Coniosporium uncinatum]
QLWTLYKVPHPPPRQTQPTDRRRFPTSLHHNPPLAPLPLPALPYLLPNRLPPLAPPVPDIAPLVLARPRLHRAPAHHPPRLPQDRGHAVPHRGLLAQSGVQGGALGERGAGRAVGVEQRRRGRGRGCQLLGRSLEGGVRGVCAAGEAGAARLPSVWRWEEGGVA